MKTLIVYTSQNGTSEQTATHLFEQVGDASSKFRSDDSRLDDVDVTAFEAIVFGAGIYAGRLNKKWLNTVKAITKKIEGQRLFFYVHGLLKLDEEDIRKTLDAYVNEHSYQVFLLGGQLDFQAQNVFTKTLLRMVAKANNLDIKQMNTLNESEINRLARDLS